MSATDELRRMLDERGINYVNVESIDGLYWGVRWFAEDNISAEWRENGKRHELLAANITPEQAIAATLGVPCETCPQMDNPDSFIRHLIGRGTCELEELARDMYKAIVMMIAIPGYADAHRSELEAIDDRAHSLGVVER